MIHLKWPMLEDVDCLSVSRFTDNLGTVPVTTKDTFTVEMSVGITAEIPERSVYRLLYETGRQGHSDIAANVNPNIVNTPPKIQTQKTVTGDPVAHLLGEVGRHDVDVVSEVLPRAGHIGHQSGLEHALAQRAGNARGREANGNRQREH